MSYQGPRRLVVVAKAKENVDVLHALCKLAGEEIEHLIHFGKRDADFKASSLFRLNDGRGNQGHLLENSAFENAAQSLENSQEACSVQMEMIDHLYRIDKRHSNDPHALEVWHDYVHILPVLNDAVGALLKRERIDAVIFFDIPHLVYDTALYYVAKSLGIQTIVLRQSYFPRQFFSMQSILDLGHLPQDWKEKTKERKTLSLPKTSDLFYMKGIGNRNEEMGRLRAKKLFWALLHVVRHKPAKLLDWRYLAQVVARMRTISESMPSWKDPFARFFHTDDLAYFEHVLEMDREPVDLQKPFIYFALHLQPEMTVSTLGGRFRDQALALERLAGLLPEGHWIYVKENPKQDGRLRRPVFFHRLNRIKNLRFVPGNTDSQELIKHSLGVATLTGTVGWEALLYGKPTLTFGASWYGDAPGVTRYDDRLTFDAWQRNQPSHDAAEHFAASLELFSHKGNVQHDFARNDTALRPEESAELTAQSIWEILSGKAPLSFPDSGQRMP